MVIHGAPRFYGSQILSSVVMSPYLGFLDWEEKYLFGSSRL